MWLTIKAVHLPQQLKAQSSLLKRLSCLGLAVCTLLSTAVVAPVSALSAEQKALFDQGVNFFDAAVANQCTSGGQSTQSQGSGGSTIGQVMTFALEPITATWNIPNSTVEQWFLKQTTARATVGKYGLNASNIGQITSAVVAANVSPVFFYAYTVSEGGGAGGFINHYQSDTGGGGPGNAKRDADYLASQSKIMDSKPSWVDAGNPVDFVPQNVQAAGNADFLKAPSGTIGRAYIPATAAAAWEVYYPNGLKQQYNKVQDYGAPLSATMQNIKAMGGDPLKGGSIVSTSGDCGTNGVTGTGMQKAISFAVIIAKNNGYGYDQPTRETGYKKYQSDPTCTTNCGSFDCSSFISAALTEAGYFTTNPNFITGNEASELEGVGFKQVATSAHTSANLQPGDILLAAGHTEMYIGNNQNVGAHSNENGGISGGTVGDKNGTEISVTPFYDGSWIGVYRAPN